MKAGVKRLNEVEFTRRVKLNARKLYCVAYSILWNDADCADAMQDAVAKVWQHRDKLRDESSFDSYLVRALINRCKSMRRPRRFKSVELTDELTADEGNMPADIDLRDALKSLPEKYRLPLILHYQDGFSIKEISDMLRLNESLVKSRLHQARTRLKRLLGGDSYET